MLDGRTVGAYHGCVTSSTTAVLRLGSAALVADPEFLAAVDCAGYRHGLNLGLLAVRAAALATCMMMASHMAAAQRPTAESARAVRHHAHVMGLPVGGAQ